MDISDHEAQTGAAGIVITMPSLTILKGVNGNLYRRKHDPTFQYLSDSGKLFALCKRSSTSFQRPR
jgi:hypothetical protein